MSRIRIFHPDITDKLNDSNPLFDMFPKESNFGEDKVYLEDYS
jgi:hypothetical protein